MFVGKLAYIVIEYIFPKIFPKLERIMISLFLTCSGLSFSDKRFLEKLYRRECRRMWYVSVKILKEKELAEDAVQTTFEHLIKKVSLLRGFENEETVSKYVFISTRNTAFYFLRKRQNNASLEETEPYLPTSEQDVEKEVFVHFDIEALKGVIADMNPIFGDALYLRYFLELEYAEIADALSIPIATARTKIFRGRQILKKVGKEGDFDG